MRQPGTAFLQQKMNDKKSFLCYDRAQEVFSFQGEKDTAVENDPQGGRHPAGWRRYLNGWRNVMRILIVVDMQTDFIDGTLGTKEAAAIVPAVERKIRDFDGKVIFTYDTHPENYLETQEGRNLPVKHCIEGTEGWRLPGVLDDLRIEKGASVYRKPTFGSRYLAQDLLALSKREKIESIELIGLCTDICVVSNALLIKAFLPETQILVDATCCAGVTPARHRAALDTMKSCQIKITGED